MIYFDNAATEMPSKELLSDYAEYSINYFANSSSIHKLGLYSSRLLEESRKKILTALSAYLSHQVVFTSGATEALNLAIKGFALSHKNRGMHIISDVSEHAAVLESLNQLKENFGFKITLLPIDEYGKVRINELEKALDNDTVLVITMAVNNETGAVNNIHMISQLVKKYPKAALLVDATQAIGKIQLDYSEIDMFAYSGHKIGGLKGCGALVYNKKLTYMPLISGGGHEFSLRSGTVDVALNYTLSKATFIAMKNQKNNYDIVKQLHDELYDFLTTISEVVINSNKDDSPYIINISLINKKASVLVEDLSNHNIMVSSVSACHSKNEKYSYVIYEMNHDINLASNTVRISFSKNNTMEEVKEFEKQLIDSLKNIK